MRNILMILALFVCTSICLGQPGQTINIVDNNGGENVVGNAPPPKGCGFINGAPSGNTVNITQGADNIGCVCGAFMDDATARDYGAMIDAFCSNKNFISSVIIYFCENIISFRYLPISISNI